VTARVAILLLLAIPAFAGIRRPTVPAPLIRAADAWCAPFGGALTITIRPNFHRFECADGRKAIASQPVVFSVAHITANPDCTDFAFCAMATTACSPEPVILARPGISFTCANGVHILAGWWGRGGMTLKQIGVDSNGKPILTPNTASSPGSNLWALAP